jgi:ArsR family transcriptional regulator
MSVDLASSTELYRLLADASRLRLLALLSQFSLSASELTDITGLAQSRVSTHISKLRKAGLLEDQRVANATVHRLSNEHSTGQALWRLVEPLLEDPKLQQDRELAEQILRRRQTWAESVAGSMELHYSPGRTWQAAAHALAAGRTWGKVVDLASGDGAFIQTLTEHAESLHCIDISHAVLAAAKQRLKAYPHIHYLQADMHAVPLPAGSFDTAFLMHALPYTATPAKVIVEAARLLCVGGELIISTLHQHDCEALRQSYDHINLGCTLIALKTWLEQAGLQVRSCQKALREGRAPYFEVLQAVAVKA